MLLRMTIRWILEVYDFLITIIKKSCFFFWEYAVYIVIFSVLHSICETVHWEQN